MLCAADLAVVQDFLAGIFFISNCPKWFSEQRCQPSSVLKAGQAWAFPRASSFLPLGWPPPLLLLLLLLLLLHLLCPAGCRSRRGFQELDKSGCCYFCFCCFFLLGFALHTSLWLVKMYSSVFQTLKRWHIDQTDFHKDVTLIRQIPTKWHIDQTDLNKMMHWWAKFSQVQWHTDQTGLDKGGRLIRQTFIKFVRQMNLQCSDLSSQDVSVETLDFSRWVKWQLKKLHLNKYLKGCWGFFWSTTKKCLNSIARSLSPGCNLVVKHWHSVKHRH